MRMFPHAVATHGLCPRSCACSFTHSPLADGTLARCGEGWLEEINGYPVLHLKGTPYEMGYQHGALLKDRARDELREHPQHGRGEEDRTRSDRGASRPMPSRRSLAMQTGIRSAGILRGAGRPLRRVGDQAGRTCEVANFIPELFHCSGFAIMDSATADGTLYHGRVLDYAINWGLQDHAVIIVCTSRTTAFRSSMCRMRGSSGA